MPKNYFSVSAGPQFMGGKSAAFFLVFLTFLIVGLVVLFSGKWEWGMLLLAMAFVLAYYMLDIRGIQFNLDEWKYRAYVLRPWGKEGEWKSYQSSHFLELKHEFYTVKTVSIQGRYSIPVEEKHWRFALYLIRPDEAEPIMVFESQDVLEIVPLARSVADKTGLTLIDRLKERYDELRGKSF
ncbi:MAG: hypothetical protein EA392_12535 [Cryomorphaceae bacterium]|nr:MAG: hypothetical protein EA392_12535 [Cryomorphaceae bacterium]